MKILIAEDEMVSRLKLVQIFSKYAECHTAATGQEAAAIAIKEMQSGAPFDLMTLDLDFPDKTGDVILREIRKAEKEANSSQLPVFVITGSRNRQTMVNCAKLHCRDIILKPFNRDTLLARIKKGGIDLGKKRSNEEVDLRSMAEELFLRFKQGNLNLPSLPQVYSKFRELRAKEASFKEIRDLLKNDISINATIIKVANSAMFGGYTKYTTLNGAMQRLGLAETEKYVHAIASKRLYEALPKHLSALTNKLWKHSLATAFVADGLNQSFRSKVETDAFTMGMMHEVGKLLLIILFNEIATKKKAENLLESDEFLELLDTLHEKFGSALLNMWKFDATICHVVRYHDSIEQAKSISRELALLRISCMIARTLNKENNHEDDLEVDYKEDISYRLLKLEESTIEKVLEKAKVQIERTKEII